MGRPLRGVAPGTKRVRNRVPRGTIAPGPEKGDYPLNIEKIDRGDDLTRVALSGRLDSVGMQNKDTLFFAETVSRGKPAIVDMTDVEFIASRGIGMLINTAKSLSRKGCKMVIVNPNGLVADVMSRVGLNEMVPFVDSAEAAEQFLKGS